LDTFWDIYYIRQDFDLAETVIQKDEVAEIKWADMAEVRRMLRDRSMYEYPEIYEVIDFLERQR
jgi:isopentenyldiphosphate isomerase